MISVVTIVKDDLYGFMRTRSSLEEQTFHHWEHIIVPASPGDSTSLLAGELSLGRTALHVQDGSGIYSAMNQGLALATQDFVVFLNAGDMLAGAQVLKAVSNSLGSSNARWCVFGGYVVRGDEKNEIKPVSKPTARLIGFGRAKILHPSIYYRRDFLLQLLGYNDSFQIAGDLDLNIRAAKKACPDVFDYPVAIFFADGISSTRIFSSILECRNARSLSLEAGWLGRATSDAWCLFQLTRSSIVRSRKLIVSLVGRFLDK